MVSKNDVLTINKDSDPLLFNALLKIALDIETVRFFTQGLVPIGRAYFVDDGKSILFGSNSNIAIIDASDPMVKMRALIELNEIRSYVVVKDRLLVTDAANNQQYFDPGQTLWLAADGNYFGNELPYPQKAIAVWHLDTAANKVKFVYNIGEKSLLDFAFSATDSLLVLSTVYSKDAVRLCAFDQTSQYFYYSTFKSLFKVTAKNGRQAAESILLAPVIGDAKVFSISVAPDNQRSVLISTGNGIFLLKFKN